VPRGGLRGEPRAHEVQGVRQRARDHARAPARQETTGDVPPQSDAAASVLIPARLVSSRLVSSVSPSPRSALRERALPLQPVHDVLVRVEVDGRVRQAVEHGHAVAFPQRSHALFARDLRQRAEYALVRPRDPAGDLAGALQLPQDGDAREGGGARLAERTGDAAAQQELRGGWDLRSDRSEAADRTRGVRNAAGGRIPHRLAPPRGRGRAVRPGRRAHDVPHALQPPNDSPRGRTTDATVRAR
jgi:hypothetical protein